MTQPVQTAISFRKFNDDNGGFIVEGDELKLRVSKLFENNPATMGDLPMFAVVLTNQTSGKLTTHYVYITRHEHDVKTVNYKLLTELYVKQIIAGFQDQYESVGGFLGDTEPLLVLEDVTTKGPEAQYEQKAGHKFGNLTMHDRFTRNYARFGYDGLYLVPTTYAELYSGLESAVGGYFNSKANNTQGYGYGAGDIMLSCNLSEGGTRPAALSISHMLISNPSVSICLSTDQNDEQLNNYGAENESVWFKTEYRGIKYVLRFTNRAQFGNEWTNDQINMVNVHASSTIINALFSVNADKDFITHLATLGNYDRVLPAKL